MDLFDIPTLIAVVTAAASAFFGWLGLFLGTRIQKLRSELTAKITASDKAFTEKLHALERDLVDRINEKDG